MREHKLCSLCLSTANVFAINVCDCICCIMNATTWVCWWWHFWSTGNNYSLSPKENKNCWRDFISFFTMAWLLVHWQSRGKCFWRNLIVTKQIQSSGVNSNHGLPFCSYDFKCNIITMNSIHLKMIDDTFLWCFDVTFFKLEMILGSCLGRDGSLTGLSILYLIGRSCTSTETWGVTTTKPLI